MIRRTPNNIVKASKNLGIRQNVLFRVVDEQTGKIVQEHSGHNSATNSLLLGIAHHLIGDFFYTQSVGLNPAYPMLSNYVPRYISLGTMGLINQNQDASGLPAGIGITIPSMDDPEYRNLKEAVDAALASLNSAKDAMASECPYWPYTDECANCQQCSDRISAKKQALEEAQAAYDEALAALIEYSEEQRFIDYMETRPGYGADGYDANANHNRKYPGLGYAFTSYDVTATYLIGEEVTNKGTLYRCIQNTSSPAGVFDPSYWEASELQPGDGTTVNLELISPSFPRALITFRDIVPEYESEIPRTIDVVFSAMISTGALAQFRPEGQDFIFITEAGLWSKRYWENSGENGLLAAYRIGPPNEKNWPMNDPANRELLKRQILRVGKNQCVQVIWKIQIGSIDEFTEIDKLRAQYYGELPIVDSEAEAPVEEG